METPPEEAPKGIAASLSRLLHTLVAIAGNRAELLAVEVREEAVRWLGAMLLVAALVAVGTFTLALITLTVVVFYWDDYRMAALLGLSGIYLLVTVALAMGLRWRLQHWPTLSATVAELKKDQELWSKEKP